MSDGGGRVARRAAYVLLAGAAAMAGLVSPAVAQSSDAAAPAAVSSGGDADAATSGEIIVTANKRAQALRSVANSVTALTGDQLTALGAQSFKDYLSGLPGVQFQQSTPGVSNVTLRGIGTATIYPDQGQATTGIYINDIPLTDPGFALSVPDLDPFDLQRVEVLRGPQGTLFGAATLGGAINYIYNPVSLTDIQAKAQVSLYGIHGGSDVGFTTKAALNVPIVKDVFGIRVTASHRSDPGYLDNVGTGDKDSNTHRVNDVHVNALLKISDALKLSYFFFYDHAHNGDGFYSFPDIGDLKRDTIINETATFITRVHNMKLDGDLGFASLTVSAADSRKKQNSWGDLTPYYGDPTIGPANARNHSQTAEARLTSPSGQRFEWLLGAYYDRTNEGYPTPTFQNGVDIYDFTVGYKSHEKSVFGEATYHLTDTLRATFGGRYYDIDLSTRTTQGEPGDESTTVGKQKGHGFSPKGSITYEPSKNFMIYGLISKGFRMGGVNLVAPIPSFPTPATYGSDSVLNYEIGTRFSLFDRTLLIDTTAFYVDWSNIQLRLARPDGRSYVANAGSARSYGLENAITWRPNHNLDFHANVTYLNAEISKTLELGDGSELAKGENLPGASHWSTSESATYHFDLPKEPYVTLQHQYISHATNNFTPLDSVGGYNTLALRVGARFGRIDAQAFVTNLTDKRGVATADFFGDAPIRFYIQPRMIGLSLDWSM
ncbi:TonB-dependent receptor [Sphingomonas sp. CGMCC 1.13654]|uniref:TonB-dependent receptor n=1 Tax=Sphingomonas chungangi TaxID=2683589 RepID=A0A838L516_9SPHN|nr:TonB-dependent receptor [Sphingomonas chungangi]